MNARNPRLQLVSLLVVAAIFTFTWYQQHSRVNSAAPTIARTATGEFFEENHYSPDENLEQLDLQRIDRAQRTLDIAMYAFTDKYLAEAVVGAARRGVVVRLYRDHQQYQDEQKKATEHNSDSSASMMNGERNIHIRVKDTHELMHLKAYVVDGTELRDGSANWSPSGLKRQDNNARFTTDPTQVSAFLKIFEEMWAGRNNAEVQ